MAKQLVQPDVNINEYAGMCLSYSRRAYRLEAVEPTAYDALKKLKFFHADRNFPDVAVPVWFEWWGDLKNGQGWKRYDHVAVRLADGNVWSSPLSGHGRAWFNTVDDLIRAFGNGMKFLGWSEDISGTRVVNVNGENKMENISKELENTMSFLATGDYPGTGYDYRWTGQPMTESVMSQFVNFWLAASRDAGITAKVKAQDEMIASLLATAGKTPQAEAIKLEQVNRKAQEILEITK